MTDDELERALFALPLEEPPVDLHARILAATVDHRPRLAFRAWEIWLLGTVCAFMVWLMFMVGPSVPDLGATITHAISDGIDRIAPAISVNLLMWAAVGVSLVVWISQLSLPPPRREAADR